MWLISLRGMVQRFYNILHKANEYLKEKLDNIMILLLDLPLPSERIKRGFLTGRLHGTIGGPTGRSDPGYVRLCQTSRTDRLDRL